MSSRRKNCAAFSSVTSLEAADQGRFPETDCFLSHPPHPVSLGRGFQGTMKWPKPQCVHRDKSMANNKVWLDHERLAWFSVSLCEHLLHSYKTDWLLDQQKTPVA